MHQMQFNCIGRIRGEVTCILLRNFPGLRNTKLTLELIVAQRALTGERFYSATFASLFPLPSPSTCTFVIT